MAAITILIVFFSGYLLGILSLFAYMVHRMMQNGSWDDSNMTNAIRLISHVVLHPEDFGLMWYISGLDASLIQELRERGYGLKRPFWYVSEDELSEVVKSRP